MFKIAIDLGYGYVKGVNEAGERVSFPSLVGPGRSLALRGVLGGGEEARYQVTLAEGGKCREYFVGELAREECPTASYAFQENKITHPHTRVLLATAAALLTREAGEEPVQLATGLPLQHFLGQRQEFQAFLEGFRAQVRLGGEERPRPVSFARVTLFPQGAGAMLEAGLERDLLLPGTYLGLVDVGFRTTDFVVYQAAERFVPRPSLCGTVEVGMADLEKAAQAAFAEQAGATLDLLAVQAAMATGRVYYAGRDYDLREAVEAARRDLATAILDRLKAAWGQRANFLRALFLAGGGALELEPYFRGFHGDLRVVPDPRFANAWGFLRVIGGKRENGNAVALRRGQG